jgi:type VI secretion system secreted protein VgrG
MSGFPTPCVISAPGDGTVHLNDATALHAQTDVAIANVSLTGMACTTDLTGQDLGTVAPLAPGVYCFSSTAQLTGTLTLSGPANGLWVFKIGSTFTTAAGATITGTAPAANIFFVVGSDAPIGATNSFRGNIIAAASITLGTGTSLTGRALAKAAITMDTNQIVLP